MKTKKFENLINQDDLLNLNEKFIFSKIIKKFRFRQDFNCRENFSFNCSN